MLRFRSAIGRDAEAIAALHTKSWQQNYRGALSDEFLDNEAPSERLKVWQSRLKSESRDQIVILAENDGELVGFVCVYLNKSQKYGSLLDNLHVHSAMQGKGIGYRLMSLAAKEVHRQLPNSDMYLWVLEQNSGAIQFYENLGGEKIETVEEIDIGNQKVFKSRYYWKSLQNLLTEN